LYPNEYRRQVYFIEKTVEFGKWLRKLKILEQRQRFYSEFKELKVTDTLESVNLLAMVYLN